MKIDMTPKAILDIKGMLMQCYHGGKDTEHGTRLEDGSLVNSAGWGFQSFWERYMTPMLQNFAPINVIAVWDGGREYRTRLDDGYKAKRDATPTPDEQKLQLENLYALTKQVLAAIGCTQVAVTNTEADDVIAFLCQRLPCNTIVYTNDADLLQLHVNAYDVDAAGADAPSCTVMLNGQVYPESYKEVPLEFIAFHKALCGDKSDCYGGVYGFGDAKFQELLANYGADGLRKIRAELAAGNVEKVAKLADKYEDKVLAMICQPANFRDFSRCWQLANLAPHLCDTVVDGNIRKPKWFRRIPSEKRAADALNTFGLGYLLEGMLHYFPTQTLITSRNFGKAFQYFCSQLHVTVEPVIAFDYESYDKLKNPDFEKARSSASGTYVDVLSQEPTGMSITFGRNFEHTFYFSVNHADTQNLDLSQLELVFDAVEKAGKKLAAHNAEFERTVTKLTFNREIAPMIDTLAMLAHVDENWIEDGGNGLKDATLRVFNYKQESYADTLAGRADMREVTGLEVLGYGCDDAVVTAHHWHLADIILACENQRDFFLANEPYVIAPFSDRLIEGMTVDFDRMFELRDADQIVIDDNTAVLRAMLAEHCANENVEAAKAVFEKERGYLQAKFSAEMQQRIEQDKEVQHDYVEAKLSRELNKLIENSKFVMPGETRDDVKFTPTPAKIREVMETIGAHERIMETMPKSFTAGTVSKWIMAAVGVDMPGGDVGTFFTLIGSAAGQLKDREGDEYLAFESFCKSKLPGKVTKTGTDLNLNSSDQVKGLLYCMLGLPVRVLGKVQMGSGRQKLGFGGGPATDSKAVAMAIAYDAPEPDDWRNKVLVAISKIKKSEKRFEMYYDKYLLWVHPRDGKIHAGIRNNGTMTRRPSGSNPNILQLSKGETRSMILPCRPDHVFVDPDFNGQELRIMASEAREPVLTDAYIGKVKKDPHSLTAAFIAKVLLPRLDPKAAQELEAIGMFSRAIGVDQMFFMKHRKDASSPYYKVFNEIRDKYAKAVNFLIIYGGGFNTLARNIGCAVDLAKEIMQSVFQLYGGIKPWQAAVIDFARTNGYVETAYGTRKHVSADVFGNDEIARGRAERQAVNHTIQGCAADMLKYVVRRCGEERMFTDYGATALVAPIYDEVLFSVPKVTALEFSQKLIQVMSLTPPGHVIPQVPELSIGLDDFENSKEFGAAPRWDEVAEYLAKKETSAKRFYLPDWKSREAA
jgi:DNA polymerase I-like protein with 3'-5' exonuclease and polymerase domains/5'-3' exonuclease